MLGVHPYIAFPGNCREAIEFYKAALGAEVLFLQTMGEAPVPDMGPAQNIMHCTLRVGGSQVMVCDDPQPGDAPAGGGKISLAMSLDDPGRARQVFDSLARDGSVEMPLQQTYWAEAFGMVTDRFGVRWMINCEAPR